MNGNLLFMLAALLLVRLPARADTPPPPLNYTVSWVGNSFSGKDAWVLQDVDDLCVLPVGTLFTNVGWDEAGGNVQEYRAGSLVAVAGHTHGWGYGGGAAVAANAKYLFIAQQIENEGGGLKGSSWPAKGLNWSGVSRRLRTDIQKATAFEGGHGKEGDVLPGAFLPIDEYPEGKPGAIRGLAATDTRLYVSDPFEDAIKIYDPETMQPLASWPLPHPDKLCLDKHGNTWVLQRPATPGEVWQAVCVSASGHVLPQKIVFPAGVVPTAVCVDARNRLLVADAGPDNQIKIYAGLDKTPALAGTFGVRGGIFARPAGQFGDRRFNHLMGIGADAGGNVYVTSCGTTGGGSTVMECYAPAGKLLWRRFGLLFVDCPAADPRSPDDVYTKEEHFTRDDSRPAGQDWTYRGYTVNPYKYPDDPRLHVWSTNGFVREISGHPFLFVTDMTGESLQVYRFHAATDGETAIPCGLFEKRHVSDKGSYPPHQPERGEWAWMDRNGNGQMDAGEYVTNGGTDSGGVPVVDAQGTVWQAFNNGIRAIPVQGLNAQGVPQWDYAQAKTYPKPAELDEIRRLRYLPDHDVMLLGGNRGADHNQHWKPMGPVLCLYDGWSTGTPVLRRSLVLPYEKGSGGNLSNEPISFDVAGDYVFVAYTQGLKAEGLKNAFVKVLRLSDLSVVGNLSAESVLGDTGLLDLVESVSATKRANGDYVVFLEDDYKSKSIVFRWHPGDVAGG